jgi:hypothetical protein
MPTTIRNGEQGLQDFTPMTALVERNTNLLQELGLFETIFGTSTVAAVERETEGSDAISAKERGGERNYASKNTAQTEYFKIPFYPLDFKQTAADIQDFREFATSDNPMTANSGLARALKRITLSHDKLKTQVMYNALKGSTSGGGQYTIDLATKWGVTATTANVDFTNAAVNPAQIIEKDAREVIQTKAQNAADQYQVICICGSGWFNGLVNHPLVQNAFDKYSSAQEPLRQRLGSNLVNRSFDYQGITYLEDATSGQIARGDAYVLPLGIADMFQLHYAPADVEELANTVAQEQYIFEVKTHRNTKLETECSFQAMNSRPELVIKSTGTLNAED